MQHIIVTGGLGAGKTKLIQRINEHGVWVNGSPADTMKRSLAHAVAYTYSTSSNDPAYEYFSEMIDRHKKEKYRELLQAYGEFFSNQDPFFWIHRVMKEVLAEVSDLRYAEGHDLDYVTGTTYDSIRRPHEIIGVKEVFAEAVRVHLSVSRDRQLDYLESLGYTPKRAFEVLNHPSEHWLTAGQTKETQPDVTLDADQGDDYIWEQYTKYFTGEENGG